jgi:hypothetical protein
MGGVPSRNGSRHPLDRGSVGHPLRAAMPPVEGEPEIVTITFARTYGEVGPGASVRLDPYWFAGY